MKSKIDSRRNEFYFKTKKWYNIKKMGNKTSDLKTQTDLFQSTSGKQTKIHDSKKFESITHIDLTNSTYLTHLIP